MSSADLCGLPLASCSTPNPIVSAEVGDSLATEVGKSSGPTGISSTVTESETVLYRPQDATIKEIQTRIDLATNSEGVQPSPSGTSSDGSTKPLELAPTGHVAAGLDSTPVPFSTSVLTSSLSVTTTLTNEDYPQPTFTTIVKIVDGISSTITVIPSTTRTTTVTNVQTRGASATVGTDPSSGLLNPSPLSTLSPSDSIQSDNKTKVIVPSVIVSLVVLTFLILSIFYWRRRAHHSKYAALTPYTMSPTNRGHCNRLSIYRRVTPFQGRPYALSQHSSNESLAPLIAPLDGPTWIPRFLFKPRRVRDLEAQLAVISHRVEAITQAMQSPVQGLSTPASTEDSHDTQLASYNSAPDEQAWGTGPPPKYVSGTSSPSAPVTGLALNPPGRKRAAQNIS